MQTQTLNMVHMLAVDFNTDLCFPFAPLDVQTLQVLAQSWHPDAVAINDPLLTPNSGVIPQW